MKSPSLHGRVVVDGSQVGAQEAPCQGKVPVSHPGPFCRRLRVVEVFVSLVKSPAR